MIKVENLKKTYDRRSRNANQVLHGMSFTLPDRGFVCILGASGCGKTSLLNAIGGLDSFDSGKIITENARIARSGSRAMEKERNANFGYIFQNYYLLGDHSAAYNIYLGMHSMPLSKKEKMQRVKEALEKVDMLRYRKRPVGQLSGGQQQRIAIARAIARNPKVIFADEPTGNLDEANTMNICSILKKLSHESLVVMVTHEQRIAKFFADRIITIEDGNIIDDSTDWQRGTMDAGEKDAVYSGEYEHGTCGTDKIDIRVLSQNGAAPISLTIITEKDRIIIKTDDQRVVLCSEANASPKLIEGDRPILSIDSFDSGEHEEEEFKESSGKRPRKSGLGLGFLLREAGNLASSKRLGKIGMRVFIVLLSLMIVLAISDIITLASIDPEDFIINDSHVLEFQFERGKDLPPEKTNLTEFKTVYREHLEASGVDFDYIISTGATFEYIDRTVPQLGELSLKFSPVTYANISRLDPNTIIYGKMPERTDEIVIDRWLLDKYLSDDGIIQNVIPNIEYFIGKRLTKKNDSFSPKIVGICDSGEPTVYMDTSTMMAIVGGGIDAMPYSEFCDITGYDRYEDLAPNECIIIADNAGIVFTTYVGKDYYFGQGRSFFIKDAVTDTDDSITVKYVLSDEAINNIYKEIIVKPSYMSIWCDDKAAMLEYLDKGMPDELEGMINVKISDKYTESYNKYLNKATAKADARTIVTVTVLALSVIMLYLMQRSKINENMDIIAVYRLLGIPRRNLVFIFATESVVLTLKYATPTVLASWLVINGLSQAESLDFSMLFPISAVGITLAAILAVRIVFSVVPVLRLLSYPPAKLAAKYDF